MLTHAYPHKTRTYGFTAFITLAGALFAMGYSQAGSLEPIQINPSHILRRQRSFGIVSG